MIEQVTSKTILWSKIYIGYNEDRPRNNFVAHSDPLNLLLVCALLSMPSNWLGYHVDVRHGTKSLPLSPCLLLYISSFFLLAFLSFGCMVSFADRYLLLFLGLLFVLLLLPLVQLNQLPCYFLIYHSWSIGHCCMRRCRVADQEIGGRTFPLVVPIKSCLSLEYI